MQPDSKPLDRRGENLAAAIRSAQVVVSCSPFQPTLDFFVNRLGFHVDVIFPADAPTVAVISGHGISLRIEEANGTNVAPKLRLLCDVSALPKDTPGTLHAPNGMEIELVNASPPVEIPPGKQEFVITRLGESEGWRTGRATMQYRDLIPSRLGGRFIASHVRIPDGGPVPDYVHSHRVRFQMIFCRTGWVKVVYEDQGAPFVMQAGDCVLQPPEIRHQVLEASDGLEVIEVGCPAVHETVAHYEQVLPNDTFNPDRLFSEQRFLRHVAKDAKWSAWKIFGFEMRDTGITAATNGLASVRVIRAADQHSGTISHNGEFLFFFILRGELSLGNYGFGAYQLRENESCLVPAGAEFEVTANVGLEMLEVALPADPTQNN